LHLVPAAAGSFRSAVEPIPMPGRCSAFPLVMGTGSSEVLPLQRPAKQGGCVAAQTVVAHAKGAGEHRHMGADATTFLDHSKKLEGDLRPAGLSLGGWFPGPQRRELTRGGGQALA
jgi:hypothetical protein